MVSHGTPGRPVMPVTGVSGIGVSDPHLIITGSHQPKQHDGGIWAKNPVACRRGVSTRGVAACPCALDSLPCLARSSWERASLTQFGPECAGLLHARWRIDRRATGQNPADFMAIVACLPADTVKFCQEPCQESRKSRHASQSLVAITAIAQRGVHAASTRADSALDQADTGSDLGGSLACCLIAETIEESSRTTENAPQGGACDHDNDDIADVKKQRALLVWRPDEQATSTYRVEQPEMTIPGIQPVSPACAEDDTRRPTGTHPPAVFFLAGHGRSEMRATAGSCQQGGSLCLVNEPLAGGKSTRPEPFAESSGLVARTVRRRCR
jgi:hypothetical protein